MQQSITAGHAAEHHEEHPTVTGINNVKMLMWVFLASDCMFFGSLITAYVVYMGKSLSGPLPHEVLDIPYTSVSAFVLLLSSLCMVLALAAIQRGDNRGFRVWLGTTVVCGLIFLGGQFYEFSHFFAIGLNPSTNLFGSSFFVTTGFHGLHVTIGVIWLISLIIANMRGQITQANSLNVEVAGLYWHFVDIVWIVVFAVLYLIPVGTAGVPITH